MPDEQVAFLLAGIDSCYVTNGYKSDNFGYKHYHFWEGRFKPLDEKEIDISLFNSLLKDVNDGKVKFDDEDVGDHMKPKKQLEFATIY